ncbi:MAG: S-methyl-5-thioribose-1-phosphate isomerase [Calditrichia bacterium]
MIKSIEWTRGKLVIIDQTLLPHKLAYLELVDAEPVFQAIRRLSIRGAPAIGIAAAYGLYLGLKNRTFKNKSEFLAAAKETAAYLNSARPTAVNLRWALDSSLRLLEKVSAEPAELLERLFSHAEAIHRDDEKRCNDLGKYGAELIPDGASVLTHCNTGALATGGIGTALGAVYSANQQGKRIKVWVDETRPLLQGARLNMWELQQNDIPATLITDSMAAYAMQRGMVDLVIVGADRITRNGDVANKIGTYNLAVNCRHHQIPFYVSAPLSTFDFTIERGEQIPIEERNCREITTIWDKLTITVEGASCWNPAFDVTPAELISGIITEIGVIKPPFYEKITEISHQYHQTLKEPVL